MKTFKDLDSIFDHVPTTEFFATVNTTCSEDLASGYLPERFLTPPHPDFLCLVCRRVANQPKECKDCQRLVCAPCAFDQCPNNCAKDSFRAPTAFMTSYLATMQLKCSNADQGCQVVAPLCEIEMHEVSCEHRPVTCLNPVCRKTLETPDHGSLCSSLCLQVMHMRQLYLTETRATFKHKACQLLANAKSALYEEARDELLPQYVELDRLQKTALQFVRHKQALQQELQQCRAVT